MFPILMGKNNDLEKRVKTLEDSGGGSSGGGVLVATDTEGTLDKTWQEIHDAAVAVVKADEQGLTYFGLVNSIGISGDVFGLTVGANTYLTSSANGYPVYENPTPPPSGS